MSLAMDARFRCPYSVRARLLGLIVTFSALCSPSAAVYAQVDAGVEQAPQAPEKPATASTDSAAAAPPANPAPSANPASPQGPVLVPPQLKTFAPAEYPAAAIEAGLTAEVELLLVIDEQGKVIESTIATPAAAAGQGFDEAAQAASFKLVFEPASRDGVPIKARARFPYVFELQVEQPAQEEGQAGQEGQEEAPVPAEFGGQILDDDKAPVASAKVRLLAEDGSEQQVTSGDDGEFTFPPSPPGTFTVRIEADEFQPRSETETLVAGERTSVVYQLEDSADPDAYGAVARIRPPPREVTRHSIGRTQLTRIPGTRGDALRAVELMPGVARPPFGAGALIIRGSSPQDSQVQLEGAALPLLYHFGGLTSAFNSQLLESVEFFPGNFSTRYGRRRGGIVEVNVRDPNREKFAGLVDINLIDAYAVLEGPITDDLEVAVAFRRSYVDLMFNALVPEDEVGVIAAPVYYDYQTITTYRPTDRDKFRLMVFGSADRFEILFTEPASETGGADDLNLSTQFHRIHGSWYRKITDDLDHALEVAAERRILDFGLGEDLGFMLKATALTGRSEWTARLSEQFRLIAGLDLVVTPGRVEYTGPPVDQAEGNPNNRSGDLSARETTTFENDFIDVQTAAYLELDITLGDLRLVPGVRMDYFKIENPAVTVDPRLSGVYTLSEQTRLKAGIGLFSQPPQPQETVEGLGNPDLKPMTTLHTGAGIEHDIDEGVNVGAELFYKHLFDLTVSTENGAEPRFVNGGAGRIYGLELSAKIEPTGRFFGYASYTLSRSERKDLSGSFRLFDFDQTHILTLSSVYRLGAGWELGGTFRLVSGNPTTPVSGGITSLDSGTVQPLYSMTNSHRSALFHRLDVLLKKTWDFDSMKIAVYLDIQNIYNQANPEGLIYGERYKRKATISGLPILPNLGVRGEF